MEISDKKSIFATEDAILLAGMCYQSYLLYETGKLVRPKGFEITHTIRAVAGVTQPAEEVFGFIAESENKLVVAFRGTASAADAESGQDFFQVFFPYIEDGGKTHRGSTAIYQSARNRLIRELATFSMQKKLYITGHSLGASLATLCAIDLAVNTKFKNPIVYTYGSGRVGDPAFAARFNKAVKHSFRIFNVHDPVPTYPNCEYPPPFTKKGLAYRHVGQEYPLFFQLNNMAYNHSLSCYFKNISELNPAFTKRLSEAKPGFCPDTSNCCLTPGPGAQRKLHDNQAKQEPIPLDIFGRTGKQET